jgi:hypothetical protein
MSSGAQPAVFLFPTGVDNYSIKVDRGTVISGDGPFTVPAIPAYEFYLSYVPQSGTVSLAGYTEVTGTPGTNQYQVTYSGTNAGLMTFNGINAGDGPLYVSYTAFGDIARAFYFNDLQQSVETIENYINSGLGLENYLPTSGGTVSGTITLNGASIVPSVASGNDIGTAAFPFDEMHASQMFANSFTDESSNGITIDVSGNTSLTTTGSISTSSSSITGTTSSSIHLESSASNISLKALTGQIELITPTTTSYGDMVPASSGTNDLGSVSLPWGTIYADNIVAPLFQSGVVQSSGGSMTGDLNIIPPAKIRTDLIQNYSSTITIQSTGAGIVLQSDSDTNINSNSNVNITPGVGQIVTISAGLTVSDAVIAPNTDIIPFNSGTNDLGSASNPFDYVYANNYIGLSLSGNFVAKSGDSMYGDLVMGDPLSTGTQPSIHAENIQSLNNDLNINVGELAVTATNNVHFDLGPSGNQILELGLFQIYFSTDIIPTTDSLYDIGSPSLYVNNLYARNIHASGITGTTIDGATLGDVTITGNITMNSGSSILAANSGTVNIGSSGSPFGTLYVDNIVTIGSTGAFLSKFGDTIQGNLLTNGSGVNDIGSASVPFNAIYADNIISSGLDDMYVNVTGDSMSGPLTLSEVLSTGNLTISGASNVNIYANQIAETAEQVNISATVGPVILDGNTEIQLLSNSIAQQAITQSGTEFFNDLFPNASGTYDIGTPSLPFRAIYADFLVPTSISGTGNFVLKAGDSMIGALTMQSGANIYTAVSGVNDIGSASTPWNAVYANNFYLSGSPFGTGFVHTSGDTMTGDLWMNGANITAGSTPFTIFGSGDVNLNALTGLSINAFLGDLDIISPNGIATFYGSQTILGGGGGSTNIIGGASGVWISGQSGPVNLYSSNASGISLTSLGAFLIDTSATTQNPTLIMSSSPSTYFDIIGRIRLSGNAIPAVSGSYLLGTAAAPFSGAYVENINGREATYPIYSEIPSGSVDGVNTVFATAFVPVSGTERLYRAGLRMTPYGIDYSIAGNTITFVSAPSSGDNILVDYERSIF